MKAFFVLDGLPLRNETAISLLSALAVIETAGPAEDLLDAIGIIRHWHPSALLFDGCVLEERSLLLAEAVREGKVPVVIMRSPGEPGDCTYLCADFSGCGESDVLWRVRTFGELLRGYHRQDVR